MFNQSGHSHLKVDVTHMSFNRKISGVLHPYSRIVLGNKKEPACVTTSMDVVDMIQTKRSQPQKKKKAAYCRSPLICNSLLVKERAAGQWLSGMREGKKQWLRPHWGMVWEHWPEMDWDDRCTGLRTWDCALKGSSHSASCQQIGGEKKLSGR